MIKKKPNYLRRNTFKPKTEMSPRQLRIYNNYTIRDRKHQVHFMIGEHTYTINFGDRTRDEADALREQLARDLSAFLHAEVNVSAEGRKRDEQ